MALFETPETLHYVLLTFVIRLCILKIPCRPFSLRGLLTLLLLFLFLIICIERIIAWKASIHDSFQKHLLLLNLLSFLGLNFLDLGVDTTLDVHLAHVLDPLLAFNFV